MDSRSLPLYVYIYNIYIYIYLSIYTYIYVYLHVNIYISNNQGGELVTAFSPHLEIICHHTAWRTARLLSPTIWDGKIRVELRGFFSHPTQKNKMLKPPKKKQMEVWFRGLVDFNDFPLKFPIKCGGALVVLDVFLLKHCFVRFFFRPQSTVFGCPVFVKQTISVSIFDTLCKAK